MHEFWKRWFREDEAGGSGGGGGGSSGAGSGGDGGSAGAGLGLADGAGKSGAGAADGGKAAGGEAASGGDGGGSAADKGAGGKAGGDKGGSDWRSGLPEAIRGSKSLEKFKDTTALAQSYLSLEQAAGKKGLVVPGDQATQDEWNAFFKAIGRPESAEKYELKNPDGLSLKVDENFAKGFKEVAHKLGVPAKMAAGLYEWYMKEGDGRVKASSQKMQEERKNLVEGLKKEWGDQFAGNLNDAKIAIDAVVPDDLKKWFKETGLAEDPRMARIFQSVAKKFMSEDELRGDGAGGGIGATVQDLENELKQLNDPATSPRFKMDDPKKEWANNRIIEIRKELKRLKGKAGE